MATSNPSVLRTISGAGRLPFTLTLTDSPRVVDPASQETVTVYDRVIDRRSAGTVMHDRTAAVTFDKGVLRFAWTHGSSDEAVAEWDGEKFLHKTDGVAHLRVSNGHCTKGERVSFAATAQGSSADYFSGFVASSLGKHCSDAIDTLIAGKSYCDTTTLVYSSQNHSAGTYVRNTQCWAYGLDMTCCSPWNSYQTKYRAGTLVSPQDGYCAAHYEIPVGTRMRFIALDNTVHERTVTHMAKPFDDLCYFRLDSDLPVSIKPAKVLPVGSYLTKVSNWQTSSSWYGIPALCIDAEERAFVKNIRTLADNRASFGDGITAFPQREEFNHSLGLGDSGNPAFVIINGELVAIVEWLAVNIGTNPGAHNGAAYYLDLAMAAAGSPYRLTEANISAFPNYSAL